MAISRQNFIVYVEDLSLEHHNHNTSVAIASYGSRMVHSKH